MEFLPLLLVPFIVVAGAGWIIMKIVDGVTAVIGGVRVRRRARIEAELDRTQAELRATILQLASVLGADAHEARKALIRESFLASGKTPQQR
jgi:hypothetical protein